jgi:methionine-rich copper-binding protein CopC
MGLTETMLGPGAQRVRREGPVDRSSAVAVVEFQRRPQRRRAARALALLLCAPAATLALMPGSARAHAIIVAAQPAMNATVAPGEIAIRLDFNSRLDSRRSSLRLQRPDGTAAAVVLTPGGPPGVLAGRAELGESGLWKLRWQALSLDGHITRGEVIFSVRDAP